MMNIPDKPDIYGKATFGLLDGCSVRQEAKEMHYASDGISYLFSAC